MALAYNHLYWMQSHLADKGKFKHWTWQENLQYYFFLILHLQRLQHNKKESKIYVHMSKYLQKTSTQCRTHHEKKLKEITLHTKQHPELKNISIFYHQNYKQRLLGFPHLQRELLSLVERKEKQGKISVKEGKEHRQFISDIELHLCFCLQDVFLDEEREKGSTLEGMVKGQLWLQGSVSLQASVSGIVLCAQGRREISFYEQSQGYLRDQGFN